MSDQASAPKLVEEVMTIASTPCGSAKLREGAPCCSRDVRLLLVTGLLLVDAVAVRADVVVSFGFCLAHADLNFLDLLPICEFFHCLAVVSVLIFCFWPVFDRSENTKTGCTDIWMLSGSSSAVVGLVLRLGRVPAPPSQLFKDAPDPTSQGGVGNRN